MNRAFRQYARGFGKGACAPVRSIQWPLVQHLLHQLRDLVVLERAMPSASGQLLQASEAIRDKSLAPIYDRRIRHAELLGDRAIGDPIGGQENDLGMTRHRVRQATRAGVSLALGSS